MKIVAKIAAIALVALLVPGCAGPKDQLYSTCATANRLVISTSTGQSQTQPSDAPRCEIADSARIAAFWKSVELEDELQPWHKCLSDVLIEFYRNQEPVAEVSVDHGARMSWRGGQWSGQAQLTESGIVSLNKWLRDNTCPTIQTKLEPELEPTPLIAGDETTTTAPQTQRN